MSRQHPNPVNSKNPPHDAQHGTQDDKPKGNCDAIVSGEVGVKLPKDFLGQQEAAQNKSTSDNKKQRFINWLTLFAIMAYTTIAVLQWLEIHQSGVDTRKIAKAAIATNRAWIAPNSINLFSSLESGTPLKFQIGALNLGREPALGVVYNIQSYGVPYIPEDAVSINFGPNITCKGLEPTPRDGIVFYPIQAKMLVPQIIPDTLEKRQLIEAVMNRKESLVIDGCFAYRTVGEVHTSMFRYFLRDRPGISSFTPEMPRKPSTAWQFNVTLTGNEAN
jgi:hypothetical protein